MEHWRGGERHTRRANGSLQRTPLPHHRREHRGGIPPRHLAISNVVRVAGACLAAGAAWFGLASITAFYWLFDRSELLSASWLTSLVPVPRRWVQLSVFLEETTLPVASVFPEADGVELDVFSPAVMTESAVNRARSGTGREEPVPCRPDALAVADDWSDATIVTLIAHELRKPELRQGLFAELARITHPKGRVVLVEHTRNLAALLAYGPGWWHFMPAQEWHLRGSEVGLQVVEEHTITPFVNVFVLAKRPC